MVMYVVASSLPGTSFSNRERSYYLGASQSDICHFCGGESLPFLQYITLDGDEMTFVKSRFPTLPWRVKSGITYNRGQTFYGDMARLILGNWED